MRIAILLFLAIILFNGFTPHKQPQKQEKTPQKNIIFILSDDHRYDFMGFMGKVPFLETPNMDRMAAEGAHIQNAFVSTSLCSPSRASILTGQYAHHHGIIDNQSLVPDTAVFFPQYLQKAGYETAFIGKWHMGEHHNSARPGFDFWASFRGQGQYYNPLINVNGEEVQFKDSAYVTDVLTDYALDFLQKRNQQKPFFLYLSHKAVHAEFLPAPRHRDRYAAVPPSYPKTMFPPGHERSTVDSTEYNYADVPNWVKTQRYSWHGVDYMYHGQIPFDDFYRRYCETLLGVDESIGKVLAYLEANKLLDNSIIFYMGDNGFSFGEHGLIDKRQAYEESMRVPLLVMGENMIAPNSKITEVIQNIDIAPTILELAGAPIPATMDGASFASILLGKPTAWKDTIYYEYFWERAFPQTPTVHAVRTDRYKYIRYHGIWDINELYDLQADPEEMNNLIRSEAHTEVAKQLNQALFQWLEKTNGEFMPLKIDQGKRFDYKYRGTY
ncbi:MAG: acetylglucosamine-6-sulfatase [Saprospiraceae bacterium]|nr:MAG: acetylglucosamine-6-sulfatase [Saprospiraceae bacterium]